MPINEFFKQKLNAAVHKTIAGTQELIELTLEMVLSDEIDETQQIELLKAVKGYRKFKEALEVLRDSIREEE